MGRATRRTIALVASASLGLACTTLLGIDGDYSTGADAAGGDDATLDDAGVDGDAALAPEGSSDAGAERDVVKEPDAPGVDAPAPDAPADVVVEACALACDGACVTTCSSCNYGSRACAPLHACVSACHSCPGLFDPCFRCDNGKPDLFCTAYDEAGVSTDCPENQTDCSCMTSADCPSSSVVVCLNGLCVACGAAGTNGLACSVDGGLCVEAQHGCQ